MNKISEMLFKEKPLLFLICLNKSSNERKTIVCLSKQIKSVFSHTSGIVKSFEKEGVIETEKRGRAKLINLTKKGKTLVESINKITNIELSMKNEGVRNGNN